LISELKRSLRRLKAQRASFPLTRRPDEALSFADVALGSGSDLMLDTTVYIDTLQGRAPAALQRLLDDRIAHHSAVALAELTHLFGRLDPAHAGTAAVLSRVTTLISAIPLRRLTAPSLKAWSEAGMLAGLAARLTGRRREQALLNDALLWLHAGETGRVVLTRNAADFDLLEQLAPGGRLLVYRRAERDRGGGEVGSGGG